MAIFGSSVGGAGIGGGITLYLMTASEQPITARDNTIWIQTDTVFSGKFVIDNTEPSSPAVGDVWIQVSTVGVSLNVAKDINICPNNVKIYENGVWSSHPTKAYVSGTWRDVVVYIVNNNIPIDNSIFSYGGATSASSNYVTTSMTPLQTFSDGFGFNYTSDNAHYDFIAFYYDMKQFTQCKLDISATRIREGTQYHNTICSWNTRPTTANNAYSSALSRTNAIVSSGNIDNTFIVSVNEVNDYGYCGFITAHTAYAHNIRIRSAILY